MTHDRTQQIGDPEVDYDVVEHVIYHKDGRFTTFTLPLANLPETEAEFNDYWSVS